MPCKGYLDESDEQNSLYERMIAVLYAVFHARMTAQIETETCRLRVQCDMKNMSELLTREALLWFKKSALPAVLSHGSGAEHQPLPLLLTLVTREFLELEGVNTTCKYWLESIRWGRKSNIQDSF